MGGTRRSGSQRSWSDCWDARRSAKSFTASHSILVSTKPVQRAVLFPPGREGTDRVGECLAGGHTGVEVMEEASSGWSEAGGEGSGPS